MKFYQLKVKEGQAVFLDINLLKINDINHNMKKVFKQNNLYYSAYDLLLQITNASSENNWREIKLLLDNLNELDYHPIFFIPKDFELQIFNEHIQLSWKITLEIWNGFLTEIHSFSYQELLDYLYSNSSQNNMCLLSAQDFSVSNKFVDYILKTLKWIQMETKETIFDRLNDPFLPCDFNKHQILELIKKSKIDKVISKDFFEEIFIFHFAHKLGLLSNQEYQLILDSDDSINEIEDIKYDIKERVLKTYTGNLTTFRYVWNAASAFIIENFEKDLELFLSDGILNFLYLDTQTIPLVLITSNEFWVQTLKYDCCFQPRVVYWNDLLASL